MTMLTIDTEDSRTVKALAIAADAGQWIKCRSKDGHPLAFGVPSRRVPGRYYLVTTHSCQCTDFQRRGQPCKHIAAVAIHIALVKAEKSRPARRTSVPTATAARYDGIFKRFEGGLTTSVVCQSSKPPPRSGTSRSDMKSADVLKVADACLAWVERPHQLSEGVHP